MKTLIAVAVLSALSTQAQAQTPPPPPPVGCTINQYGRVADGAQLWATTMQGIPAVQRHRLRVSAANPKVGISAVVTVRSGHCLQAVAHRCA